jgi:hypothetical protein
MPSAHSTAEISMNHELISDAEAKALSRRLADLGDQVDAIEDNLASHGYGRPAAVKRGLIEELAMNAEEHQRLRLYWREFAKERLASLAGPVNIPRGRYPPICEYRSAFITQLRDEALKGLVRSEGSSPQIEPTYKRFVERKRTPQQLREMATAINNARIHAASALGMAESAEYTNYIRLLRRDKVAEIVAARFLANMERDGFAIESNPMKGLVCRKSMRGCGLDFVLIFQFTDALLAGVLYPMFALMLPAQVITPGETHRFSVASFSPEVLVPEFYEACAFSPDSHAQMCLAVDSISLLSKIVYERLSTLLGAAGGVLNRNRA